jgi:hypothetical protein
MNFYYDYQPNSPTVPAKTDLDRLTEFVDDVKSFLRRLSKHRPAFVHDVYDDVVNAWKTVESRFDGAIDSIRQAPHAALEKAGLTGAELKLKLRNVEHAFGELLTRNALGTLRHLFDTINSLLKSIAEACGIGTALEEIKDAIRDAMAWARG